MALVEALAVLAGLILIALGFLDIFLTILHPDRDGPLALALNRGIWLTSVKLVEAFPRAAREVVSTAGGLMIAATIFLWMSIQILGFALLAWPFLDTHFTGAPAAGASFVNALYWSGITFTTLGYGDITPVTTPWRLVALVEAMAGFALVGGAVAFLLGVFQGIDLRDKMALRIYSETRRTWDGIRFVVHVLQEEHVRGLQEQLEAWAEQIRSLHERLYRFQPLALYIRTRNEKHEPERMLDAVAEVILAAGVIERVPGIPSIRSAAEELEIAYTEFALSTIRHHGSRRALLAMLNPQPNDDDRNTIQRVARTIEQEMALPAGWRAAGLDDPALLEVAARLRVFMEEVNRITRWRTIQAAAHRATRSPLRS